MDADGSSGETEVMKGNREPYRLSFGMAQNAAGLVFGPSAAFQERG